MILNSNHQSRNIDSNSITIPFFFYWYLIWLEQVTTLCKRIQQMPRLLSNRSWYRRAVGDRRDFQIRHHILFTTLLRFALLLLISLIALPPFCISKFYIFQWKPLFFFSSFQSSPFWNREFLDDKIVLMCQPDNCKRTHSVHIHIKRIGTWACTV